MKEFKGTRTRKGELKWIRSGMGFQVLTADSYHSICEATGKKNQEEQVANAQLIATAPELLDRLQSIVLSMKAHSDYQTGRNQEFIDYVELGEETISKALGV
jgi:hypothetical protein